MNYVIEKNGKIYESHVDNVSWSEIEKIQTELNNLQLEIREDSTTSKKFFEKKGDTVIYNMNFVKQYLQSCVEKEILKLNPTIIMAVQIALESQNYDVGVIDGLLGNAGSDTRKAVMIFQKQCGLKPDGIPGKETIKEILNILGNPTSIQSRKKAKQQMGPNPFPEENKVVQPKFEEGSDFYLQNRKEFIENSDILQGPKLKAKNSDQVGGIGSSMMLGFSRYGSVVFKNMEGIGSATTRSEQRYWKQGQIGTSLDGKKLQKYCENKGIKSFVLYFGGNEASGSLAQVNNAYNDIKLIGEYLESLGVQPVLCTCIGEKRREHSVGHHSQQYPLVEFNQRIRDLGREKNWPVIDYASIDIGNVRYSNPKDIHPATPGYKAMGQKIIDNLSK